MGFIIKISALSLLSFLILSCFGSLWIESTKAYDYGYAVFNPNCFVNGVDSSNEIDYTDVICGDIDAFLNNFYGSIYYHYWCHGSEDSPVYPSDYTDTLETLQDYCTWVTVFSKGHCVPWGYNFDHRELLCTLSSFDPPNGQQVKDSTDIWPHTDGGYPK